MIWLLLLGTCGLTCLGQIAQKCAVERWRGTFPGVLSAARSRWLWLAMACLGLGLLGWLLVLQRLEVSLAYPMLGLNVVLITLTGRFVFKESIDALHWLGVALILAGVVLLGRQA